MKRRLAAVLSALTLLASCGGSSSSDDATTTTLDPQAAAIAAGNVALCNDGTYSDNTDFSGTCSSAGGVDEWLAPYGECADGKIIRMSGDASCKDDEFKGLLPLDFEPDATADDVALCKNGTYSDNTDFSGTCSSAGGVDEWLAPYGECADGKIIRMSGDASCKDDEFKGLLPLDFEPEAGADDVALCKNGTYSDNTDFSATCSGGGGVDRWLAKYAECADAEIVRLVDERACTGGKSGFVRLIADDAPAALAADRFGVDLLNETRCDRVGASTHAPDYPSIECVRTGGGVAYLIDPAEATPEAATKAFLTHPSYNVFSSTFVFHPASGAVVFAPSDFDFWGADGPDWDEFNAMDTDCLDPGVDDPTICGVDPQGGSGRCLMVPQALLNSIAEGRRADVGTISLRNGWAVLSADFENVYMIAAELSGPGVDETAVWASNSLTASGGLVLSVDANAKVYTVYPDAQKTDAKITTQDDG